MSRGAILLSLLSIMCCWHAHATTETHIWALGRWPHRYGLIGVSEGPGEFYTFIEYGSGIDFISLPLHIYWVVAIANLPIFAGIGFLLFRRCRHRHANARLKNRCMKTLTLTLAVIAIFCGCATQQTADAGVEDWRGKQTGGVCPVHRVAMRTEIVHAAKPDYCAVWPDDYVVARRTRFPYAGVEYGPELYSTRRGKIYVCPSCVLARPNG